MNESHAVVTGIEGDFALVEVRDYPACGQCPSRSACGGGERRPQRVRNTVGARIGDRVLIRMADGSVLKVAMAIYGYPLMAGIAGAAAAMALWDTDGAALAGLVAGLAAGIVLLRPIRKRLEDHHVVHLQKESYECE